MAHGHKKSGRRAGGAKAAPGHGPRPAPEERQAHAHAHGSRRGDRHEDGPGHGHGRDYSRGQPDDHGHDHGHPHGHGHDHGHPRDRGHDHPHGHGANRHEAIHRHGEELPHGPGQDALPPTPHGKSPAAEHRSHAPTQVGCFVLTCSDSRAQVDDVSGRALREGLQTAGHTVVGSAVVKDEPEAIRTAVLGAIERGARAVLVTGGTGITRRDQTLEAIRPLMEREIPGFGELFRMLSFAEVGGAAWLSRATAGTVRGALVFLLPGSPNAVRLALERLILPELGHAVRELSR